MYEALAALGHVVHSLQDFFMHTNYVELVAASGVARNQVPVLELWSTASDATIAGMRPGLVSGSVLWEPRDQCPRGQPTHAALNKDNATTPRGAQVVTPWDVTHYRAAYDFARSAAVRLVKTRLQSQGWTAVADHCGPNYAIAVTFDQRRD
jgi:hypothetical protein